MYKKQEINIFEMNIFSIYSKCLNAETFMYSPNKFLQMCLNVTQIFVYTRREFL